MSDSARGVFARIRWPRPFAGLQDVTLADVPREISAGVTLAALMIPLNIGYAQVAGLPPAAGLYAAIVPLVVFALLASSRHLVTSPDASMATLVGAALVSFAAPGDPLRMQYALALAIVCAVLFFLFWIFRLAFLANFLSRAVMAGFITGLGIEVLHQPGAEGPRGSPRGRRHVRRAGCGGAPPGDPGDLVDDRGLLRRGHRPHPLHPPRQPLLGGDRGGRLSDRPADETVRAQNPRGAGGVGTPDDPRRAARPSGEGRRRARQHDPLGAPGADPAGDPAGRLPSAAPGRHGDCGHPPVRRPAGGPQLQQQVRLQGRRRPDALRLGRGQPGGRLHRVASSRATAPPARRRWMPRVREASCQAWWRPGPSRW